MQFQDLLMLPAILIQQFTAMSLVTNVFLMVRELEESLCVVGSALTQSSSSR